MIISNIKFFASSIAPKPQEVEYWIDITENPYGGVIKYYNGIDWISLNGNIDLNDFVLKGYAENTYAKKEDIPNTSNFITNSVNDLLNYYSKNETYSSSQIDEKIKSLNSISFNVVDELPINGESNIIYLVPSITTESQNERDEYIWINDKWELIGTTKVDLSDYYTKQETNDYLNNKVDKEDGKSLISDTEIERLASVNNYDDSQVKEEIESLKQNKIDNTELINLATKQELTEGLDTKLDKGDYITEIKTINGLSLIGNGNLEIQSESEGILDAPSDGNKYVRLNNEWVIETTIDTSSFALKEELPNMENYLTNSVAEETYAKKTEIPELYQLPIATSESLGGIKVGAGLAINSETGVLSATGGGVADSVDWANITSKPDTFTPSTHVHTSSDITDLQDKLDDKVNNSDISDMATKTWVNEQGYLTEHLDISQLATKEEVLLKLDVSTYNSDKSTFALKSEIPNVDSFITNTVDNLTNYYLKTDTYTKNEVNSLIDSITTINISMVDSLPETGENNIIYLIPSTSSSENNVKDEYIWINNSWELIGSTKVDLTGYATLDWVESKGYLTQHLDISGLATKTELNEGLETKQPIGDYLIEESDPTVPSWAKQATKPTYTASEVGALSDTTEFKTINNESILGSGNITTDTNNAVDITELVNRLMSQETCSDEDYNKLKEYCNNGIVTYAKGEFGSYNIPLYNYSDRIVVVAPVKEVSYEQNSLMIIYSEDKSIEASANMFYSHERYGDGYIGSGYKKQTSYSEITGNDTIKKAVGKLEAGLNELQSNSGNSGAVNISDIFTKYFNNSGTVEQEDYNTLKEYADSGVSTYISANGSSFESKISNVNGIIIISVMAPHVMYIESGVKNLNEIFINADLSCSSKGSYFFPHEFTSDASLYTYTKPLAYSKISSSDSINSAIGKLEAAIPPKVNVGSGSVTQPILPNKFYKFGTCTSLTITLDSEISGIYNEYMFEFTSGSTATSLGLPSTVKWNGGDTPTIEANKTYIVAIVDNIAVIGGA